MNEIKTMRLSEAIRLGAMMSKQAFNASFHDGLCALNGALVAVGKSPVYIAITMAHAVFGAITQEEATCPECGSRSVLGSVVTCLNDHHRWTREQIADFVESIENAQQQQTPEFTEAGVGK